MQNDMLKNNIAPWQEKGRWYHGIYDCVTNAFINDKTDSYLLDSNAFGIVNDTNVAYLVSYDYGHQIVDAKTVVHGSISGSTKRDAPVGTKRYFSTGRTGVAFAVTDRTSGEIECWFFIE